MEELNVKKLSVISLNPETNEMPKHFGLARMHRNLKLYL